MNIPTSLRTGNFSLEDLGLVDAPFEEAFDNLTLLASELLGAPVSLLSIVQEHRDRQYFKAQVGLPPEWAVLRQTPLSHSFCQYVVQNDAPLIVEDAHRHPVLHSNGAVHDLNVIAYLGVPIHDPSDAAVGAFCVIDGQVRQWSQEDMIKLGRLGACVDDLIRLRASLMTSDALLREQEEFTYAITHDLKSPINTMKLLHSELREVLSDGSDKDALVILEHLESTATRMGDLVNGVMSYVRLVGQRHEPEAVPLAGILAGIVRDAQRDITQADARVTIGDLPAVLGNPLQMKLLFQNLFGNALKFRNAGVAPEIVVRCEKAPDAGYVRICVQDNGIGISGQNQAKVFKLFQRLNLREDYPGTGLGLAQCRRIVTNHAGKIDIQSDLGVGTTFAVTLPAAS